MYYIGIDVGGTNLKAGLIYESGKESGKILSIKQIPLEFQDPESFAKTLANLAMLLLKDQNIEDSQVISIGIGLPGAVSGGEVLYTTNIPMKNIPLENLFRKYLDLPVYLGNDADCAAVGEYFCGIGQNTQDFVMITLGTGIGCGIILNGILRGGDASSEAGHMAIVSESGLSGLLCPCGRRGCWEQYASASALIRMTKEAMMLYPESLLHRIARENGTVDGRTPFQAAKQGDKIAHDLCRDYVRYLAAGAVNLVNIIRPEILAIGGGLAAAPEELLLNPLRDLIEQDCFSRHGGQHTKILRAELGNQAGILGAAFLGKA